MFLKWCQAALSYANVATESYSPLSLRLPVLGLWTLHPSYFEEKKNTFLHPGHPISNPVSPDPCGSLGAHCPKNQIVRSLRDGMID